MELVATVNGVKAGVGFNYGRTKENTHTIGKEFILHSGRHKLIIEDGKTSVIENGFWQGTLIYMEIGTGEEIDPNQVVEYIKHTGARSR